MDIRELIVSDIRKLLWFVFDSEILTLEKKEDLNIDLAEIENIDNLEVDDLFSLRDKLLALTKDHSMEQISDKYYMASVESHKLLSLFLRVFLILLMSFILTLIYLHHKDIISVTIDEENLISFTYTRGYYLFKEYINPYIFALMSVLLRIVFLLNGCIMTYNSAKIKRNKYIIYSVVWPPIVVLMSKSISLESIPVQFLCIILGWGVETFIKTIEKSAVIFEKQVSKKILSILNIINGFSGK
ncbi:hypothetical protein [Vibrio tetraodonis]|uniref:hypothetical protein n=1 Tax=Vibrio tetraodonis TaxID=2231647 RepID=UPI0013B388C2|nr:hypothetical protein [Vibrio tetraodonis]